MKFALITTVAATAILFSGLIGGSALAQSDEADTSGKLLTFEQKLSYILGRNTSEQLKRDDIAIDTKSLLLAIDDVSGDKESRLSEKEIQETLAEAQRIVNLKQASRVREIGETNKKEGEAFLKENGSKDGVTTTDSGLQYKVITSGEGGAKPKTSDTVTVHYKGTLLDGTVFDSSYDRGEPASFPLNGVIPGWTEVVQLMSVGDKWAVTIPSDLAYGLQGAGREIGPNATLNFEIELLKIGE